ncbi:hypothetical protein KR96_23990 [Ralstonia solanacearum]|nr:hypothetical protein KR96_23990 [Ralstonia solanacearum]
MHRLLLGRRWGDITVEKHADHFMERNTTLMNQECLRPLPRIWRFSCQRNHLRVGRAQDSAGKDIFVLARDDQHSVLNGGRNGFHDSYA